MSGRVGQVSPAIVPVSVRAVGRLTAIVPAPVTTEAHVRTRLEANLLVAVVVIGVTVRTGPRGGGVDEVGSPRSPSRIIVSIRRRTETAVADVVAVTGGSRSDET